MNSSKRGRPRLNPPNLTRNEPVPEPRNRRLNVRLGPPEDDKFEPVTRFLHKPQTAARQEDLIKFDTEFPPIQPIEKKKRNI